MVSLGASVFGGVIGTGGATPSFLLLPQAVRRASAMPAARTPTANRFIHLIVEFLPFSFIFLWQICRFYYTPPPPIIFVNPFLKFRHPNEKISPTYSILTKKPCSGRINAQNTAFHLWYGLVSAAQPA
jgi:hypothetical protein